MAKASYFPKSEKDQLVWLNNFAAKFEEEAPLLGFTTDDVTAVNNDAIMFSYMVNQTEKSNTYKQKMTQYKDLIKTGPLGMVGGDPPVAPVATAAPVTVLPGILPRVSLLVQRIKVSPSYIEAIGKNLGIVGQDVTVDYSSLKPQLKLQLKGGQVEIQWVKGNVDAIYIEAEKGDGNWSFLAIAMMPRYVDSSPITTPAKWNYRAMYLVSDEKVGQWSDITSISVG